MNLTSPPGGMSTSPHPSAPATTSGSGSSSARHGLDQAAQVLARLDRADEQQVPLGQPIQRNDTCRSSSASTLADSTPNGTSRRRSAGEAGGDAIVHRRLAAAQHEIGATPDLIEAAPEDAVAAAGELRWIVQECQIVHGDDHRRIGRARDQGRCMGNIDRPGGPLDLGPVAAQPQVVQQRPADGQMGDRDRRRPRFAGNVGVTTGDTEQRHVGFAAIASATRIAATPVPPGTRCQHCSSV